MIYLDHNSSTFVLPHVYEQLPSINFLGNADATHAAGIVAKEIVDTSRAHVAELVGAKPGNVLFTSGATEANAMALSSYKRNGQVVLASAVEHKSVLKYADIILPVKNSGYLDIDALRRALSYHKWHQNFVVACMYANNETGIYLDPDGSVIDVCNEFGAKLHIDASQCYAKGGRLSKKQARYASTIVISGHKMHAMKGVGALIFGDEVHGVLQPLMLGGSQQWGLRPGTLNTEAIYSFGVAAAMEMKGGVDFAQMQSHIREIESALADISIVNGNGSKRLLNTTNLYFPSVNDVLLFVEKLSIAGVMVSGMSACDSGISAKSQVLEAMFGPNSERLNGSIRLSVSAKTTRQEISDAIQIIKEVVRTA